MEKRHREIGRRWGSRVRSLRRRRARRPNGCASARHERGKRDEADRTLDSLTQMQRSRRLGGRSRRYEAL